MGDGKFGDGVENWPESMKTALRKDMSGLLPEIQEPINDEQVMCKPCGRSMDYTPSVLLVHNIRHHKERYESRYGGLGEE